MEENVNVTNDFVPVVTLVHVCYYLTIMHEWLFPEQLCVIKWQYRYFFVLFIFYFLLATNFKTNVYLQKNLCPIKSVDDQDNASKKYMYLWRYSDIYYQYRVLNNLNLEEQQTS